MSRDSALLTDFYQLAMLQAYYERDMADTAVFEFFVRRLSPVRGFLMVAGLEQLIDYLETLSFSADELEYLAADPRFSRDFVDHLADLRFTGDVHAMPEGTVFFAEEPVVRVSAPIAEAQIVETRLINILHMQTMIASKAARYVLAARDKQLVDFGFRRAHGSEAGLFAARASYVAGFSGTATVLAGMRYGVPTFGTMAHSFIQSHDDEASAFRSFARSNPGNVTLLIDTYDIEMGARAAVKLAAELEPEGAVINAVRIDSGDLKKGAQVVRDILDENGCGGIAILVSGDVSEHRIVELLAAGVPIDGFGVGTHLDVSSDAPYLDCVYKLQEYAGQARRKRSSGKSTWPGRKQVYRLCTEAGLMARDSVSLEDDPQAGRPLLEPVMRDGVRIGPAPGLAATRARATRELHSLPAPQRELESEPRYEVVIADSVRSLAEQVDRDFA